MKKIMYFIHGMTMGGAETLVKDYLINFDKKNYELVLLLLERHNSKYEKILKENNIKVIYVDDNLIKGKKILQKICNHIMRYIIVKKIILKEDPDIIHYHLTLETYLKYAKPDHKVSIFCTIHSEPKKLYDNSLKKRREYEAAKWLIKNYKFRFLVLHEEMKKEINKMFGVVNTIVVNNGIDFNKFRNYKSKKVVRKELDIPQDAFVIGHVGRFVESKNHLFLAKIFNEIIKQKPDSFLFLIGKGEKRIEIERKLNEYKLNDRYLILEDRIDIPELMNCMNAFVFPSTYEGLGIVLIEAQEMKLPCFKSDKVPDYAAISNLVTTISLDKTAEEWANTILNYQYPKEVVLNDKDWNMKDVVKKLEKIYEDEI